MFMEHVRDSLYKHGDTFGSALAMTGYGDTALNCPRSKDVSSWTMGRLSERAAAVPLLDKSLVRGDDGLLIFE